MDVNHNLKAEDSNRNSTSINDIFAKRQTDRKTAKDLEENIEKLIRAGVKPSIIDIRYVKLARYENHEEDLRRAYCDIYDGLEDNDENYE